MIFTFANKKATNVSAVGGKAAILAQLYQQKYPVPDGFVLSIDAFNNKGLKDEVWPSVLEQVSCLRGGMDRLILAVRSSALSEDSEQASFAGEYETVLNVVTDEEIRQAIQTVYDSQFSHRVSAYRESIQHESLNDDRKSSIAVVVQKMVNAELAGVLFTSDPVTGNHSHMVGNFVQGLGEQLVSGEVNAETFTLTRPSGSYEGSPELKKFAKKLFKMADKLVKLLGSSQDIEWAIANGKVYLLQSRAITTLQGYDPVSGIYNDSLRGDFIWTNSYCGDFLPDVMTPLTWSLMQIFFDETILYKVPGEYSAMGNLGGRIYENITISVAMMQARGFSRDRINNQIESVFGHIPIDINNPTVSFSRWQVLRINLNQLLPIVPRLRRKFFTKLPKFTGENLVRIEQYQNKIQSETSTKALAALWINSFESFFRQECHLVEAIADRHVNAYYSLSNILQNQIDDTGALDLLSSLSTDNNQLASLDPLVGLWQVANGKMTREAYTQKFGHRGPHELEVYFPPPAENPAWLDEQLANLEEIDVPALLAAQEAKKEAAWTQFSEQYPEEAENLQPKIAEVAEFARERESFRSQFILIFGLIRKFVIRAGELTDLGDGAFFLSIDELIGVLNGEVVTAVTEIPVRRQAYETFCTLPPYPTIINGRFDPITWAADPNRRSDIFDAHQSEVDTEPLDDASSIIGVPGSAGIVEGIVRVLHNLDEIDQIQPGEILVAVATNIGWTPAFPKVAAIVTDIGAQLSHAAIVARELGIPAVLRCGNATMRLKTGDRVSVDGGKGIIKILDTLDS